MNEIVRVMDVTKIYKNSRGIRNVSLAMERGEIHVLLGANGAGKSTLMKAMAGLLVPDSGSIVYCKGGSCTEDLRERLYAGGFIIEQPELFGYMTAFDNLMLKGRYYQDGKDSAEEALKMVGLAQNRDQKVKSFSTGMKQRLAMAMALTGRPEYLVLDEPSNGMDIDGRSDLGRLLQELRNDGVSILLSTHLVREAAEIADRVTVIHDGRILKSCLREEFLNDGKTLENWYLDQIRTSVAVQEAGI